MRKHHLCLHVTLYEGSPTFSYFVERNSDDGQWELWSEQESLPLSELSEPFNELQELLEQTMAEPLSSTNRSSELG